MIKIPIAIIGAGGMGGRHLRALGALYESGMANVELVAVCDKRKENANFLNSEGSALRVIYALFYSRTTLYFPIFLRRLITWKTS